MGRTKHCTNAERSIIQNFKNKGQSQRSDCKWLHIRQCIMMKRGYKREGRGRTVTFYFKWLHYGAPSTK